MRRRYYLAMLLSWLVLLSLSWLAVVREAPPPGGPSKHSIFQALSGVKADAVRASKTDISSLRRSHLDGGRAWDEHDLDRPRSPDLPIGPRLYRTASAAMPVKSGARPKVAPYAARGPPLKFS